MRRQKSRLQQQFDGAPAGLAQAGLNFQDLLGDVDVQRQIGVDVPERERRFAQGGQRNGAQAVKRHPGPPQRRGVAAFGADAPLDRPQELFGLGRESRLFRLQGDARRSRRSGKESAER